MASAKPQAQWPLTPEALVPFGTLRREFPTRHVGVLFLDAWGGDVEPAFRAGSRRLAADVR